jgi:hypothetical protein
MPEAKKLGDKKDKMQVLYIQKTTGKIKGAVSSVVAKEDAYDAEALLWGYTPAKPYQASAVARHGNFLQWGFGGSPAQMTPAGRDLLVNSLVYMNKFNGRPPLVRNITLARKAFLSGLPSYAKTPQIAARYFPPDLLEKYKDKLPDLVQYYQDNADLLYYTGQYYGIDEQLKSLGMNNNRQVDNLPRLITLLADPSKVKTAQEILVRYTGQSFTAAADWQKWFNANKDNLVFLEMGGYKFFVIPKVKNNP